MLEHAAAGIILYLIFVVILVTFVHNATVDREDTSAFDAHVKQNPNIIDNNK